MIRGLGCSSGPGKEPSVRKDKAPKLRYRYSETTVW
jgi:hypothetical protein